MEFVGILADRGGGKTNLLTQYLYTYYQQGRLIGANYHLEFPFTLMPFSQLAKLGPEIQNLVIGMDELGTGADSYDFFAEQPKKLGKLIQQIRKRNCIVFYTVQRWNLITARLRDQTDGFILMEDYDKDTLDHTVKNPETGKSYCAGQFAMHIYDQDFKFIRDLDFDGTKVRHLYNTDEIIWADAESEAMATKFRKVGRDLDKLHETLEQKTKKMATEAGIDLAREQKAHYVVNVHHANQNGKKPESDTALANLGKAGAIRTMPKQRAKKVEEG